LFSLQSGYEKRSALRDRMMLVTDSRQVEQGLWVLDVHGDLDLSTVQSMNQAVDGVLSKHPRALALDLSDVPFMDSSALAALVGASMKLEQQGAYLVVLRPRPMPRQLFRRTSVDRILLVAESIAEARSGPVSSQPGPAALAGALPRCEQRRGSRGPSA
jgi:anti-sigma B factor antagonist